MTDSKLVFDEKILEILCCPLTRSKLKHDGDFLISEIGGLRYPIRDGLPVLLIDEAELPEGVSSLSEFKEKFANEIPA